MWLRLVDGSGAENGASQDAGVIPLTLTEGRKGGQQIAGWRGNLVRMPRGQGLEQADIGRMAAAGPPALNRQSPQALDKQVTQQ